MKKTMVYILALSMAFSLLLVGCGENMTQKKEPAATKAPQTAAPTESMLPDPEDGVVRDDDGIITDNDTGLDTGKDEIPAGSNDMIGGAAGAGSTGGVNSGNSGMH